MLIRSLLKKTGTRLFLVNGAIGGKITTTNGPLFFGSNAFFDQNKVYSTFLVSFSSHKPSNVAKKKHSNSRRILK
jgi:hypothetical protein